MTYSNHIIGKHAQEILALQHPDGTWGNMFHSFAQPNGKNPLTTEQALRRLKTLGFTMEDEPIRRIVDCMVSCLRGERKIDNYQEKGQWDLGAKAKDNVYFPLADSWRKAEDRRADCTERIERLLQRLKG